MFNKDKARERMLRDLETNRVKRRAGCMERFAGYFAIGLAIYVLLAWIFCWFPFSLTSICRSIPF